MDEDDGLTSGSKRRQKPLPKLGPEVFAMEEKTQCHRCDACVKKEMLGRRDAGISRWNEGSVSSPQPTKTWA